MRMMSHQSKNINKKKLLKNPFSSIVKNSPERFNKRFEQAQKGKKQA